MYELHLLWCLIHSYLKLFCEGFNTRSIGSEFTVEQCKCIVGHVWNILLKMKSISSHQVSYVAGYLNQYNLEHRQSL